MFQGNVGKYVEFNQGYEWEFLFEDWKVHASQLDYWSPTNTDANHSACILQALLLQYLHGAEVALRKVMPSRLKTGCGEMPIICALKKFMQDIPLNQNSLTGSQAYPTSRYMPAPIIFGH